MFQKLCDYVSDLLLEESNVQPVQTPVTVCGDIHGQVFLDFFYFIEYSITYSHQNNTLACILAIKELD